MQVYLGKSWVAWGGVLAHLSLFQSPRAIVRGELTREFGPILETLPDEHPPKVLEKIHNFPGLVIDEAPRITACPGGGLEFLSDWYPYPEALSPLLQAWVWKGKYEFYIIKGGYSIEGRLLVDTSFQNSWEESGPQSKAWGRVFSRLRGETVSP